MLRGTSDDAMSLAGVAASAANSQLRRLRRQSSESAMAESEKSEITPARQMVPAPLHIDDYAVLLDRLRSETISAPFLAHTIVKIATSRSAVPVTEKIAPLLSKSSLWQFVVCEMLPKSLFDKLAPMDISKVLDAGRLVTQTAQKKGFTQVFGDNVASMIYSYGNVPHTPRYAEFGKGMMFWDLGGVFMKYRNRGPAKDDSFACLNSALKSIVTVGSNITARNAAVADAFSQDFYFTGDIDLLQSVRVATYKFANGCTLNTYARGIFCRLTRRTPSRVRLRRRPSCTFT